MILALVPSVAAGLTTAHPAPALARTSAPVAAPTEAGATGEGSDPQEAPPSPDPAAEQGTPPPPDLPSLPPPAPPIDDDEVQGFVAGESRELIEEGTEYARIYQNPDGTKTARIYGAPVRWRDESGGFRRFDSLLQPSTHGFTAPGVPLGPRFAFTADAAPLVQVTSGGHTLGMSLADAAPALATAVKDKITYADVFPDTDLEYVVHRDRVKEQVILKTPPQPGQTPSYRFPLTTNGLTPRLEGDGVIGFYDDGGQVRIAIPPGWAKDSSATWEDTISPVDITLEESPSGSWVIVVTPDLSWLTDPTRVYPVFVDPSLVGLGGGYSGTYDAYVLNTCATCTYNGGTQTTDGYYFYDNVGRASDGREWYSYIRYDMAPVANAHIYSGVWNGYAHWYNSVSNTYYLHRVTQGWNPNQLTWNNKPPHDAWGAIAGSVGGIGWHTRDMTTWVRDWANGSWANHGIEIDTHGNSWLYTWGAAENYYSSKTDSWIRVDYEIRPNAPSLQAPGNGSAWTASPQLTALFSDPDGGSGSVYFRVRNSGGAVVADGYVNAPCNNCNVNYQPPALGDGLYYWEAFALNAYQWSGQSATWSFYVDSSAPAAPGVSSTSHPSQGSCYATNAPSFAWSASDVSPISGYSYVLDQVSETTPDTTSEGTATSTSYSGLADGTWWFHVRAKNAAGLWGATTHYSVLFDATAPPAPSVSSSSHPDQTVWYTTNNATMSWSASDATCGITGYSYVLDQTAATTPDTTSEGTATSKSYSALADGTWWFHVRAQNGAGTWGPAAHFKVQVDTTAPPAPSVSSSTHPSEAAWYANANPSVSWSATDTSSITGYSYVLDQTAATTPDTTSEGTATSKSYSALADGTWWFHVRAQNGAGTWGPAAHFKLQVDTTAPPAPSVSSSTHPSEAAWYANANPSVSWSATDTSSITGYSYVLDQTAATTPDTTSEGTATSKSYSALADGTWWFHVRAQNGAGTWGPAAHFKVQVDTTAPPAPSVSSSTHPDQTGWYASPNPIVNWSGSDTSGITGYSYVLDQVAGTTPDTTSEGTGTTKSYNALANGTWWFHVRAQNGTGAWGTTTHFKIQIDAGAPSPPSVSSSTHPDQAVWYTNTSPSLGWSATAASGVAGYSYILDQSASNTPDTTSEGTATSKNYTALADGTWWFHVRALSAVGVWGGTTHFKIQVDATAPASPTVASSTHPDQNAWYPSASPAVSWSGADTSGIIGYSYVVDQASATIPDAVSEGSATSKNYSALADGTWWFHVRAQNGAGTWGPAAHFRMQVDATPPPVPTASSSTHPDSTTWYTNASPVFTWSDTDTSGITGYSHVIDNSPSTTPDDTSEGTAATTTHSNLRDGVWWFHVKARNGAGTWGTPAHVKVQVDATAPAAPTVSSASHPNQANWYASNAPVFSWLSTDVSGIIGYSYGVDQVASTVPDTTSEGLEAAKTYTGLADGVWWFHVRAQNGAGTWGATAHFQVQIDSSAPTMRWVSDSPDPVEMNGIVIFGTGWSEPTSPVRTVICRTPAISSGSCGDGAWAVGSPSTGGASSARYGTTEADLGRQDYYAFACNAAELCSPWQGDTFTVVGYRTDDPETVSAADVIPTPDIAGDYYPKKWKTQPNQTWEFGREFPGGAFRDRLREGLAPWMAVPTEQSFVAELPTSQDTVPMNCATLAEGRNVIHWGRINGPGGRNAQVTICDQVPGEDARIKAVWMLVDSEESWHTGTGTPPGTQIDLLSLATHEWGHMTGFFGPFETGHFNPNASPCTDAEEPHQNVRPTMCPTTPFGSTSWRTLTTADTDRYTKAYSQGYWLVGEDGGIFSFGDARFHGSTGNIRLNKPIVGMTPTPSGRGYWFVASDGGIFSFGDARFHGSTGNITLNKPIVGMAATRSGNGYWMVASDGGIFAFGDAPFHGSPAGQQPEATYVGMHRTVHGDGYRIIGHTARADGSFDSVVRRYGGAYYYGLVRGVRLRIVGSAAMGRDEAG